MSVQPIFVHVHVPKTAGTSLNLILQQWFQERYQLLHVGDPRYTYTEEELHTWVKQHPEVMAISSHFIRHFPPILGGRPAYYFCFLRHPIDWQISNFTYAKKHHRQFPEAQRRHWPAEIESMSFRDLQIYRQQKARENPPVKDANHISGGPLNRYFAEHSFFRRAAFLKAAEGTQYPTVDAHFQAVSVAISITVLDSFAMVGLSEQFDKGVEILRRLINSLGIPVQPVPIPRANVSSELRGDLSWINENDDIGKLVLRRAQRDIQVYEYGKTLFEKQYQAMLASQSSEASGQPASSPAQVQTAG